MSLSQGTTEEHKSALPSSPAAEAEAVSKTSKHFRGTHYLSSEAMGQAKEGFGEKRRQKFLFCETEENKDVSSFYILYCFLKKKAFQKSEKFPND